VFVRGGVPGDDVSIELIDTKSDWSRGVVVDVHEPGPARVEPPCPRRVEGCGGCDWQHIDIAAQLPAKIEIVTEALRRTGKIDDAVVRPGSTVPAVGYRTTLRVVGNEDGRAAFRRDRSHDTVSAAECLIAHPTLADLMASIGVTPDLEVSLRVSVATGELTARWDRGQGDVTGLPADVRTRSSAVIHETVAGHSFRVSAGSFFQSGPVAATLLVDAVRRAAPELATATNVVDAYAGVGLFALAATAASSELVAIESSRSAVADCIENLAGRAAVVERSEVGRWRPAQGETFDVVIADPARSGLGRPGVATLTSTGAPVIALVSCDPVALARDAALLARDGYVHDGTEVLDLFPHTHHVESVTRFVLAD